MNTPRSEETSTRVVVRMPPASPPSRRRSPSPRAAEQPLARVAVHHLRTACRPPRTARATATPARRSRSGSGCRRGPCRPAVPAPRRAAAGRCRAWCPAGTRRRLEPFSVGTSMTAPWSASGIVSGTSTSRLSPLRLNTGDSVTRVITYRSPGGSAPRRPGLALAGQPDAAAVAHAGGDVDPHPPHRALRARALAGRARIVDHGARAVAVGARLRHREDALALGLQTRGRCRPGRPAAWCRAWRPSRGRSGTAARSAPPAAPGRR